MKRLLTTMMLAWPLTLAASPAAQAPELYLLCYHEVRDNVLEDPHNMTMSVANLTQHLAWLKARSYHFVTVDELQRAGRGELALPEKSVMLTFDDCYRTHYTKVFPLLKAFDAPAVMACVGSWMDAPETALVKYGDELIPRSNFLSKAQINEMAASGLVEFASHSYDMHYAIPANPQGNTQSAGNTSRYEAANGSYESSEHQVERMQKDLARSADYIASLTGKKPRLMVWPYGAYNRPAIDAAKAAGMSMTFTLDDDHGPASMNLDRLGRVLVINNPKVGDLAWELRPPARDFTRTVQVDLDYVYDPDPKQQEANLGKLVERIKALGVNTLYLQAFADPDGDGNADAVYFPNRHLPMRADLFNRALWQLHTRAGVERVYGWLPVSAFTFPTGHPAQQLVVAAGNARGPGAGMKRLSIFDASVRKAIGEVYEDMARHAPVSGVLFHDDAVLGDNEDFSPAARAAYRAHGLPDTLEPLANDPDAARRWTDFKTGAMIDWTMELMQKVRLWRPFARSARNLFANPVISPTSEAWFAQSLPDFVAAYDEVALMAMPFMEGAEQPEAWLESLLATVRDTPGALDKTVFELQSVDWRTGQPIDSARLAAQMHRLQVLGAVNLGYYPDDFVKDHPRLEDVVPALSARGTPN